MPVAFQPLPDSAIVFRKTVADEVLGRMTIGIGRSRRDVALPLQSLPQLAIAATNVLFQGVAAILLIQREVPRAGVLARLVRPLLATIARRARTSGNERQQERNRNEL